MNLSEIIYELKNDQYESLRSSEGLKFIGSCLSYADKTVSQNYQDVFALYANEFKKDGFFIEFGATDGITGSNSYILETLFNWKGILAEPNAEWHNKLTSNRKVDICDKCVFTTTGDKIEFVTTEDAALSTVKGFGLDDEFGSVRKNAPTVQVETITLYDMLKLYSAPKVIDYLSIDTEGTEYGILNAFFQHNKDEYQIRSITVEHNFTAMRQKLYTLLTSQGYTRVFVDMSRWDDFYTKDI